MDRKTQSILFCLLFVVLAEVGFRSTTDADEAESVRIVSENPVIFLLGSSRTARSLAPLRLEESLDAEGVENTYIANVSQRGLTFVGLHRNYRLMIRPVVKGSEIENGFVGIEARASAMNDNYLEPLERVHVRKIRGDVRAFLAQGEQEPQRVEEQVAEETVPTGFWDYALLGDLETAADSLFWNLRMANGRDRALRPFAPWFAPEFEPDESVPGEEERGESSSTDPNRVLAEQLATAGHEWAVGNKGFYPFEVPRRDDLDVERMRERYAVYLQNYYFGGIQTSVLRMLIHEIREEGLTPFLYTLPVSDVHKSFFRDGDYAAFRTHLRGVAEREGIVFVDLDEQHGLGDEDFHDTHHIGTAEVDAFCERFARDALLPVLESSASAAEGK